LILDTPVGIVAARFHRGLANAIVRMVEQIAAGVRRDDALRDDAQPLVALSGGVFQNRVLFERVHDALQARGFNVLSHSHVPCNDGGLALGQAAIAAARLLQGAPLGGAPSHCSSS
jgi:hydrogenase maturation protein HypF